MATTYRVDFTLANTEDLRQGFALADQAATPIDLTGTSLLMTMRHIDSSVSSEISTANGRITLSDARSGCFELLVPAATMRTFEPGSYRHDLLMTSADGATQRVWSGTVTLEAGVSP